MKTHDPYRTTVKRELHQKEILERQKKYAQHKEPTKNKSFLSQKITLENFIYLPESIRNVMGLGLFAMIPYVVGLVFIFIIIAQANIENYRQTEMTSFLLAWTIGYEFIAVFLLLLIIKSAFSFKRN